jgi:hypothetical protein
VKIEATLIDAAIMFFSFLPSAEPFSTRHTPDTATLVGVLAIVVPFRISPFAVSYSSSPVAALPCPRLDRRLFSALFPKPLLWRPSLAPASYNLRASVTESLRVVATSQSWVRPRHEHSNVPYNGADALFCLAPNKKKEQQKMSLGDFLSDSG